MFLSLAGILGAYAFWVYLRVELAVPAARSLAVVRASVLALVLLLLFDPRLPFDATGTGSAPWVLLDASMSMTVEGREGSSPKEVAAERAAELETEGWEVFRFGNGDLTRQVNDTQRASEGLISELAPSLQLAAESGAKAVLVLSDLRFTDPVAIQSTLDVITVAVQFEDLS